MKRHIAFLLLVGMVAGPSPAQDGENLFVNGGFEDGFDPWWTYGDVTTEVVQELEGAAAPQAPAEGDHALQIMVAEGVPNFWNAGLGQGRPFEEGKVYTLSAFLKAPQGEMQINYKPEDGVTFAAPGGEMTFTFGEEWTEFSMTTPVMAEAVPAGQVIFHVAFATPGTFWMDGIRFYEGPYVPPDFGPDPDGPVFLRGDCNDDGAVNIADPVCILNWLFGGNAAVGCDAALNTNGDAGVNITDAVSLLNFLFVGGPAPAAPFPDCGPLPAGEQLGCANPSNCQ